jgi:hypothetical protein
VRKLPFFNPSSASVPEPCLQFQQSGHVAATMMVAQIKEGLKTRKLTVMSALMDRTDRVMRAHPVKRIYSYSLSGFSLHFVLIIMGLNGV